MPRNKLVGMTRNLQQENNTLRRECMRLACKNLHLERELIEHQLVLYRTEDELRELAELFK